MHITTRHFRSLAADVDELHRQNMKSFADETREVHRSLYRTRRSAGGADDQSIAGYAERGVGRCRRIHRCSPGAERRHPARRPTLRSTISSMPMRSERLPDRRRSLFPTRR